MKKFFATLVISTVVFAIPAMGATTTLTGVITDDMCGTRHMMPGKSDAVCTRACVKHGAHFALAVNDKVYVLNGKTAEIDALAGAKATVKGDLNGNTINVTSIAAAK
jgi:hypothetical protein